MDRRWLFAVAAAAALGGCKTHANARFCDANSACKSAAFPFCNVAKNECEASSAGDMAMELDGGAVDLRGPDLAQLDGGPDANLADLRPPPACVTYADCTVGAMPICDSTAQTCRPCSGAADDTQCAQHTQGTRCKLSGTNAGQCAACNVSADCSSATPVCNADGTCRKCSAHSECTSGICDLSQAATNGICVDPANIVYVNYVNDPGQTTCSENGKLGSIDKPYCQITSALAVVATNTKKYVHVAPGDQYGPITITPGVSQTLTVTIVGPGACASPPCSASLYATIVATNNNDAISMTANTNQSLNVTVDGMDLKGSNFSTVFCGLADPTGVATLTFVNSSIHDSGNFGINAGGCALTVERSSIYSNKVGITLVSAQSINSTYSISNSFITENMNLGVNFAGASANKGFFFNTVARNNAGATNGAGGIDCSAGGIVIEGSIVAQNGRSNNMTSGTQFNMSSKCSLINTVTGPDGIAVPLPGAPTFVSTSDFHLKLDTAPALTANQGCCIDKVTMTADGGTTTLPGVDIDNAHRPKGLGWDVGAHEAQ